MSSESKLSIESIIDRDAESVVLHLSGEIDVTADKAFVTLDSQPPMPRVILDFSEVSRVNSMGLAQLMRLLESWREHAQSMEARHTNRMISMLFKMTGMNRYFGGGDSAGNVPERMKNDTPAAALAQPAVQNARMAPADTAPRAAAPSIRGTNPRLRRVRRVPQGGRAADISPVTATPAVVDNSDKLTFSVSLQNNQQLSGWYFLNTLLQRRLEQPIAITINQLGQTPVPGQHGLVFAKPFDACHLMAKYNFIPVVQPQDETDEVSIITRKDAGVQKLEELTGTRVVTASEDSFVFLLGRFFYDECGMDSDALDYRFTGNEITALRVLLSGEADMLFMLRKNYHELSGLSRESTHLLEESETGIANHMMLLSPEQQHLRERLTRVMQELNADDQGKQALNDLGIQGWSVPTEDEINMLLMLYHRYVL